LLQGKIEASHHPGGNVIQEDPPIHTAHRGLLARVFTPKKMLAL
jgi:cytochrome P450